MKKNDDIVARKVHDKYFLIDITDSYADDTCTLYETNEIGYFIWNAIEDGVTVDDIAEKLEAAIVGEVDPAQLRQDVGSYLDDLERHGFVAAA